MCREGNIHAIRQCGYENQRISDFSLLRSSKFHSKNLLSKDPPHWTDSDHNEIILLNSLIIPNNYIVFIDWKFETIPYITDRRGWIYKINFDVIKSTPIRTNETSIRYRKWERILIPKDNHIDAKIRLTQFLKYQSQYRSLCPSLLKASLKKFSYHFQFVMECERLIENSLNYSSNELLSGDPPHWSVGPEANLTCDPRLYSVFELQNAKSSLCSLIDGWEALHNFVPILYPNKDTEGWEYNTDFTEETGWSAYPHIGVNIKVRRRIWIRTCIRSEWLYKCRNILLEYLNNHPRGVSYMSPIEIFLKTTDEGEWHRCIGILRDHIFELKFIDNKNKRIKYELNRIEILDDKENTFTLRRKGSTGIDLGSICTLRTHTIHEKKSWIMQFISQLELIHICSNYPLHPFGPPISDNVVIEGHMWKRGHIVPTWKFRFFQLRESGALTYYRNEHLKGRIQLKNCEIIDTSNDYSSQCSFTLKINETYELFLKTTDRKTKLQWMTGISLFCGTNQSTSKLRKLRFPTKGPLYSYENIYNESQGIFLKRFQHVDFRDETDSNSRSNSLDDHSYSDTSTSTPQTLEHTSRTGSFDTLSFTSSSPSKGVTPKKSALKSNRPQRIDEVETKDSGKVPSLPYQAANIRYFSVNLDDHQQVTRDVISPSLDQNLVLPDEEDDDDELDNTFYGLEEEDTDPTSNMKNTSDTHEDSNAQSSEAVWDDDDDEEDDKEANDILRESSFTVVSNLKEILSNHRDSATLMKLLGGDDENPTSMTTDQIH